MPPVLVAAEDLTSPIRSDCCSECHGCQSQRPHHNILDRILWPPLGLRATVQVCEEEDGVPGWSLPKLSQVPVDPCSGAPRVQATHQCRGPGAAAAVQDSDENTAPFRDFPTTAQACADDEARGTASWQWPLRQPQELQSAPPPPAGALAGASAAAADMAAWGGGRCWSAGSEGHPHACALPCKYISKAGGCKDGPHCSRCHLCRWSRSGAAACAAACLSGDAPARSLAGDASTGTTIAQAPGGMMSIGGTDVPPVLPVAEWML